MTAEQTLHSQLFYRLNTAYLKTGLSQINVKILLKHFYSKSCADFLQYRISIL